MEAGNERGAVGKGDVVSISAKPMNRPAARIYPSPTERDRGANTTVAGGRYELYSNYALQIQAVAASMDARTG
jgi:hypothetical protein